MQLLATSSPWPLQNVGWEMSQVCLQWSQSILVMKIRWILFFKSHPSLANLYHSPNGWAPHPPTAPCHQQCPLLPSFAGKVYAFLGKFLSRLKNRKMSCPYCSHPHFSPPPNHDGCHQVPFLFAYMLLINPSPGDRVFLEGKACVIVTIESLGPKFNLEYTW